MMAKDMENPLSENSDNGTNLNNQTGKKRSHG